MMLDVSDKFLVVVTRDMISGVNPDFPPRVLLYSSIIITTCWLRDGVFCVFIFAKKLWVKSYRQKNQ